MEETTERELKLLSLENGKSPFMEWFKDIRDGKARLAILRRLTRMQTGNLGDCRSVGSGVQEARIDYGPGYRLYFAESGNTVVVLIAGGVKSGQDADIISAKKHWETYKNEPSRRERSFQG